MTQHTATCRISSGDEMVARIDESDIEIAARQGDADQMTVFLRPSVARTFARGILALADEVDGGEAPADARPKVGDRLRVTKDGANCAPVRAGDIITVAMVDYDNFNGRDFVRAYLEPGDDYAYFIALEHVEPVTEHAEETLKVGDRVRVVRNSPEDGARNVGREGTLAEIDDGDSVMPYRVRFVEDSYGWWCAEVEPVGVELVTEPTSEPAASPFTAHVDEAKRLLADTDHTGADILALAVELADRS